MRQFTLSIEIGKPFRNDDDGGIYSPYKHTHIHA